MDGLIPLTPNAPEELNICRILHVQRLQALHALQVNRKMMVLQRNIARLGI
jgi:hypothetical protein